MLLDWLLFPKLYIYNEIILIFFTKIQDPRDLLFITTVFSPLPKIPLPNDINIIIHLSYSTVYTHYTCNTFPTPEVFCFFFSIYTMTTFSSYLN